MSSPSHIPSHVQDLKFKKLFDLKNKTRSWLPPVSLDSISAAEKRTLDKSKEPPQNKQSQISDKTKKIQKRQFLKNLEKTKPEPGLWVQGQIFPPEKS